MDFIHYAYSLSNSYLFLIFDIVGSLHKPTSKRNGQNNEWLAG